MQESKLGKILWSIADDLRGQMDADKFKDYMLGFIFLKFLSDTYKKIANELLVDDAENFDDLYETDATKELESVLEKKITEQIGYYLQKKHLWDEIIKPEHKNNIIDNLTGKDLKGNDGVFTHLNKIANQNLSEVNQFNLFESVDLNSSNLGKTYSERANLIVKILEKLNEKLTEKNYNQDELGDAYEYLISKFASNSGKKAGEFYTPACISEVLAKIVCLQHQDSNLKKDSLKSIYDPTCGSGSLLCNVYREINHKVYKIYGQEKNHTSYNLARMNLFLHQVKYNDFEIHLGDTLTNPAFLEEKFDAIVANPPFSLNWEPDQISSEDIRFSNYQKPPKSNADLAFVTHCLHLLNDSGTLAIILPHGVLFRGNKEKEIRKAILNKNPHGYLDAVIGLAPNLFYSTSIPVCILVFKKCRPIDNILFIQASHLYKKNKNQNELTESHIDAIITAYKNRKTTPLEADTTNIAIAKLVSSKEIESNDYNLNITRYIDSSTKEEQIDLTKTVNKIQELKIKEEQINKELFDFCKELGIADPC